MTKDTLTTLDADGTPGPAIPNFCDLAIVGAGPAGSTLAILAAERGRRVVLLEKDCHPRFHIGESLLPMNLSIFEELGLSEAVADIGVYKPGAEFVLEDMEAPIERIRFDQALNYRHGYAWQVRRAEFDALLFERARQAGALCAQAARVRDADFSAGAGAVLTVDYNGSAATLEAGFVVDASGRDGILARQFDLRQSNRKHATAALFGHFENVAKRPNERAGDISIYWFDEGWFWMIPLRDGVMSVGAVCNPGYLKSRRCDPESFLMHTLARNPRAAERMKTAQAIGKITATGNYSYRARTVGGDRWLLVGDAYAFVDPVFSSGVLMAMSSAEAALPVVEAALNGRDSGLQRRRYKRRIERGINTFSWFIYRFPSPVMRHLFNHRRNILGVEQAVISVLAGDVYDNPGVRRRLWLFRLIYALTALRFGRRAWRARRQRYVNATTGDESSNA